MPTTRSLRGKNCEWPLTSQQVTDQRRIIDTGANFYCYIGPPRRKQHRLEDKCRTSKQRTNKRTNKQAKAKNNKKGYLQRWGVLNIISQRTEESILPKDYCWHNQLPHCLGHEWLGADFDTTAVPEPNALSVSFGIWLAGDTAVAGVSLKNKLGSIQVFLELLNTPCDRKPFSFDRWVTALSGK